MVVVTVAVVTLAVMVITVAIVVIVMTVVVILLTEVTVVVVKKVVVIIKSECISDHVEVEKVLLIVVVAIIVIVVSVCTFDVYGGNSGNKYLGVNHSCRDGTYTDNGGRGNKEGCASESDGNEGGNVDKNVDTYDRK